MTDMIYKGLPVYQATIPQGVDGMVVCSLVDSPAVESDFLAFDEDKKPLQFSVQDEEQRMVLGVAMKAAYPIYRYHPEFGEFYIVYTREVIEQMVEKFFNEQYVNSVDLEHSFKLEEGVHLVQAFIKDTEKGINPVGFEDCNDGSLFFQYHIENDEIWNAIKEGTYRGFSIAGTFGIEETFTKQEQDNKQNKENRFMTKLQKMKDALRSLLVEVEMGSVATDKGVIVWDSDEEELKAGMEVYTLDSDNNRVELEDGDYVTEDGKTIVVADGKVAEIKDNEAEVAPEETAEEPVAEENAENEPVSEDEPQAEETPAEDEKDAEIERLRARIEELEAENEELKARIAELEQLPAALSAEEAFNANEAKSETGADKLRRRGYKF